MRGMMVGGMGLMAALAAMALGSVGFSVVETPIRARKHYSGVLVPASSRTWRTVSKPAESKRGKRRRLARERREAI